MRILALAGWFPYPPDNGARTRLYYLFRELGKAHAVDLLCFVHEHEEQVSQEVLPPGVCLLGTMPAPAAGRSRPSLAALLSPYPRAIAEQYVPEMAARLEAALTHSHYDLALAFEIGPGVSTAPYLMEVMTVRRVVEDLEVSMIQAKARASRRLTTRLRHNLTWWKQRQYTVELLQRINGCTVASEGERRTLQDIAPGYRPLAVVPNGLDLHRYAGDFGPAEPDSLVFPGALTYEANREAMCLFLREIFPRIRQVRPSTTLYITGRTEGIDLRRLPLGDGVILTGYLPDVRPRIARSAVCVAPLTLGGGTRIKILEAMALGTPVVSTRKGAEGLDVTPGEDILIADEPAEFAAAVLHLLESPALRAKLAVNGRRLVCQRYSWRQIGEQFDGFLQQVVQEYRRQGAG